MKEKLFILSILISSFFLIQPVIASSNVTCIDSNTLRISTMPTFNVNGNITNIEVTEEIYCSQGCDRDRCVEGSFLNLTNFFAFFIVTVIFFLIGVIYDKWLFGFIAGTLFIVLGVLVLSQGMILDEGLVPVHSLFVNGIGIIFTLVGLYLNIMSALSNKKT